MGDSPQIIARFDGDYSFLSNFFSHPIRWGGIDYPTSEHAFQAAKTDNVHDKHLIARAATPGQAKRIGRTVNLRNGWESTRVETMRSILQRKFEDKELKKRLIATHPAMLIEDNYWGDVYWGMCNGVGENMLGKLLMELRKQLIEGK